MAQLHEYQAKQLLSDHGIAIPRGRAVSSADEARIVAAEIDGSVVVKAQIHSTSRAAAGGVKFAGSPDEAARIAAEMLGSEIEGNLVELVLVDEKLAIEHEYYVGYIIDDRRKRPMLLLSNSGGSGIEERAESMRSFECSVVNEPSLDELTSFVSEFAESTDAASVAETMLGLYRTAKSCEARTAEINPLVRLDDGRFVAADARISVDDYSVFRHPELGIDMARELGHVPTELERIAWEIERDDFRGTFYFVEIIGEIDGVRIGFHGAGGGGSMASLDAAQRNGLAPACYVDTSGNPPASKVYRAARIILSMPDIKGYFLSGSGVASQEQTGLARAVIKAFLDVRPEIPAVLRLGGNMEDEANELVRQYAPQMLAPFEAYRKRDSADECAARLRELIALSESRPIGVLAGGQDSDKLYIFATRTGTVSFDHERIDEATAERIAASCPQKILTVEKGKPVLAISREEAEKGKCSECLACEFAAMDVVKIDFPMPTIH